MSVMMYLLQMGTVMKKKIYIIFLTYIIPQTQVKNVKYLN